MMAVRDESARLTLVAARLERRLNLATVTGV